MKDIMIAAEEETKEVANIAIPAEEVPELKVSAIAAISSYAP